jgi:hypothetical protein
MTLAQGRTNDARGSQVQASSPLDEIAKRAPLLVNRLITRNPCRGARSRFSRSEPAQLPDRRQRADRRQVAVGTSIAAIFRFSLYPAGIAISRRLRRSYRYRRQSNRDRLHPLVTQVAAPQSVVGTKQLPVNCVLAGCPGALQNPMLLRGCVESQLTNLGRWLTCLTIC